MPAETVVFDVVWRRSGLFSGIMWVSAPVETISADSISMNAIVNADNVFTIKRFSKAAPFVCFSHLEPSNPDAPTQSVVHLFHLFHSELIG